MPRDAYISAYALGGLEGFYAGTEILSKIGLGRSFDSKLVFYSSLFQAGIDRVVLTNEEITAIPSAEKHPAIPKRRYHLVACREASAIRESLKSYFNRYLPSEWFRKVEHVPILGLWSFIGDLLTSYQLGKPLLRTLSLPDLAPLQATLPIEILSPIQTLFTSFQTYNSVIAVPTYNISKDQLQVVDEIMASKPYEEIEQIHIGLVEKPSLTESCLAQLQKASEALYWRWKDFLRLKSSVISILPHIPDFVELILGKMPAASAKPIVEGLSVLLKTERGLLLYDASPLLQESLVGLLHQVIKAPKPDSEELDRRVAELKRERPGLA
jgi:hypothetical protein